MVVAMTGAARPYCPGWTRGILERLRRHVACVRPLRYQPGMLNTYLDLSGGRVERVVHSLADTIVLEYRGEDSVADDALYAVELGPRYLQYRLVHYTRGRVLRRCPVESVEERVHIQLLSYQRLAARIRPGGTAEICGTNNTIVPEGDNVLLGVALAHPVSIEAIEGEEEAPWFFDQRLSPTLRRVRARFHAVGYVGEGLESADIDVDALHPEPGPEWASKPHIVFSRWDREARSLKIWLMPLYSYQEEYSGALTLSSVALLAGAKSQAGGAGVKEAKKVYKKLSKHLERAGVPRLEGGLQALLEAYPESLRGETIGPPPACTACQARETLAGYEMILNSLRTGALLIL